MIIQTGKRRGDRKNEEQKKDCADKRQKKQYTETTHLPLLRQTFGAAPRRICLWGQYHISRKLFVCSGYPECGTYVGVHEGSRKPKGTLADSELRNKRIRAHRAMDTLVRAGCMSRDGVYVWLSSRLNLPYEETHIGYFSDYLCEQTILECEQVLDNWKANHEKRAA